MALEMAIKRQKPTFIDSFAGGGGASTGLETGLGITVSVAINHDPAAILMHKANHPYTEHFQASVWDIDPRDVCKGRPVDGAWFSPDCKHFSKAKGAALRDRKIRGLAWIALRWAGLVRPKVIFLENVEEFLTWGPVRKGKPVKKLAGTTFRKFVGQLEDLGYTVEYRILNAADYGAPTTRKRFVLIARCDGNPVVWPDPTHAPIDSAEVKSGKLLPWRSAAEIIDWTLPCPSIFDTRAQVLETYGLKAQRPLRPNTMRRIIRGVDKHTIRSGQPFIVPNDDQAMAAANLIQYHTEQNEGVRAPGLNKPMLTVDAANRYGMVCANLVEYYGNGQAPDAREPMRTITSHDREAVVAAHVVKFKGTNLGTSPEEPMQTITGGGGTFALCKTHLYKVKPGADIGHWPEIRSLLNEYCGYELGEQDLLLLEIDGALYYINDIGMRMLTPRELYNAMGFPPDYIIDVDYMGNPYPKNEQVARCGNAVCPPMAAAVARANFPELAAEVGSVIATMEDLMERIAV